MFDETAPFEQARNVAGTLASDRYWLLTWTTYGTHLPGDRRGFVSPVADGQGGTTIHNVPGTDYDEDDKIQRNLARAQMKHDPVYLDAGQADAVVGQFIETSRVRRWRLLSAAVMREHAHVALGVPGDPDPSDLLRDLKSYASRALNRNSRRAGSWWTESGSKRKLPHETAVFGAVKYVLDQKFALAVWCAEIPELSIQGGRIV